MIFRGWSIKNMRHWGYTWRQIAQCKLFGRRDPVFARNYCERCGIPTKGAQ